MMPRALRTWIRAACVLTGVAVLGACSGSGAPPRTVLLLTLDTTRADRIGCYGYARAETPNLDRLALEGVRFEQAQSPVPVTLPSHATMFTGQLPPVHGVRYNGMFRLPESAVTFAERLRDAGWITVGIPASFPLATPTGIGQGFDTFLDMYTGEGAESLPINAERSASEITDLAIEQLRKAGGESLALWLHYWDPHNPYEPPFPFSASHRDRPYDGEIAFMDREIGRLFETVKELGRWEDALVVIVGDHGEGLHEHRENRHGLLAYQSTLRVPLIVRAPGAGRSARVVDEPVSLADIAPTLLDYAGVAAIENAQGISLRPVLEGGEAPRRSLYFESLVGSLLYGYSPLEGMRRGPWKWIRSSRPELYRLDVDPDELQDQAELDRDVGRDLDEELTRALEDWTQTGTDDDSTPEIPLDDESLERLASLGYVGGTVSAERRDGPAPRNRVHLEGSFLDGRDLARGGQHAAALRTWRSVLAEDPENRYVLQEASYAAERIGELKQSYAFAERLVAEYPEFLPGVVQLGMLHVHNGEPDRAVEVFGAGREHHPDDAGLRYRLVLALIVSDRVEDARVEAIAAIEDGATDPEFVLAKALCDARTGRTEAALSGLEAALDGGYLRADVLLGEPMLAPLRAVPGALDLIRGRLASGPERSSSDG